MAGRDPKYGRNHQKLRERLDREVRLGLHVCSRCSEPILGDQAWDLDHHDDGVGYRGPSHRRCNIRAANELRAADAKRWRESTANASPGTGPESYEDPDWPGVIVRPW